MPQLDKFIKWCIKKGKEGKKHRGLKKVESSTAVADEYIEKATHYLKATIHLKDNFSDVAVTQAFYTMYHCLLAILAKHGYESRNQKCTFAAVEYLIDQGKIELDKEWVRKIATYDENKTEEEDVITLREEFQYGRKTEADINKLNKLIKEAKEFIEITRELLI